MDGWVDGLLVSSVSAADFQLTVLLGLDVLQLLRIAWRFDNS